MKGLMGQKIAIRDNDKMIPIVKLVILMVVVYLVNGQSSTSPIYSASPHSRSGTWVAFTTLKSQTDTFPSYTVLFTTPLANNPKVNAIISVSSLQLLSSTQFSFNTSVSSISINGFEVQLKIVGNTYVNTMKFNYLGMSWATGPSSELLYYDCFLTSDLSYISDKKNQQFTKQELVATVVDGTKFSVQSFITGMTFLNNKDSTKKINVKSSIKNNTDFITQQVFITGNTILEYMCLGTVVIDNTISPWKQKAMVYQLGSFILDYATSSIDSGTFPTGYEVVYDEPDRMFFGLIELELALGKPYQIVQFMTQNFLDVTLDYFSLASGGRMAYLLYVYRLCTDTTKPLYSLVDKLCWDTCPDGQVQDATEDLCLKCHYTCKTCTGPLETQCSDCDEPINFRKIDSGTHKCQCKDGYFQNGVPICSKCSDFLDNCVKCTAEDVCTQCQPSTVFEISTVTNLCVCKPSSYYVPADNLCALFPGCLDAYLFTNIVKCDECDKDGHFKLNQDTMECQCMTNYIPLGDKCIDKCGDGINPFHNSTTYCDDGNLNGGDGCSATCAVEPQYGCFVPPGKKTSYCSQKRSYQLKYLWAERVPHQNAGLFIFQVSPPNVDLSVQTFTYYGESTIPNTLITGQYDPTTSLLRIKVLYLQTIQDQTHTLEITLDPYKISVPTQSFTIKTTGVNYDLTFDSNPQIAVIIFYLGSAISGLIVIASIVMIGLNYKIGAVQLLLSTQVVYLGVLSTIHDSLSLYPLTGLKFLFGYNTLKIFDINKLNYQTTPMLTSGTFAEYLLNFNVTPGLIVLVIFLIFILKINVWIRTYQRNRFSSPQMQQKLLTETPTTSLKQLSTNIKNAQFIVDIFVDRVYFAISLIAYFPLIVYFSFQLAYIGRIGKYEISSFANIILSILLLLLDFSFFIFIFQDSDKKVKTFTFGAKKLKNYPNRLMMGYFLLVCGFNVVLLSDFTFYVLMGLNILVGVYIWVENPYERFTLEHIDALSKPVISLVCLFGIKMMEFIPLQFIIIPVAILGLLFISMVVTIVRTVLVKIRQRQNARKFLEQADMDDQDMDEKNNKNSTDISQLNSQKMRKKINGKIQDTLNKQGQKNDDNQNNDDSAGQLNKDNENGPGIDNDELGDQNEDELTKIKRSLRQDLKKRRGVVNKANEQGLVIKQKKKKKSRKISFEQDYMKGHDQ